MLAQCVTEEKEELNSLFRSINQIVVETGVQQLFLADEKKY